MRALSFGPVADEGSLDNDVEREGHVEEGDHRLQ
jgi:hypothetical protein